MWGLRAENADLAIPMAKKLGDEIDRAGGDVVAGDCHLANTAIAEQTGRVAAAPAAGDRPGLRHRHGGDDEPMTAHGERRVHRIAIRPTSNSHNSLWSSCRSTPTMRRVPAVGAMRSRGSISVKQIKWRELGACRGLDASIFYPDDDDEAEDAKHICAGCGVRVACLEHALATGEGVSGAGPRSASVGASSASAGEPPDELASPTLRHSLASGDPVLRASRYDDAG